MPIIIRTTTYEWLKNINVFKNIGIKIDDNLSYLQVPYDEQIYL